LRVDLPLPAPGAEIQTVVSPQMRTVPEGEPLPIGAPPPRRPVRDPVLQSGEAAGEAPTALSNPIRNFAGLTSASNPPDTVGDIGTNHYVQMVNATQFKIWNKSGVALTGAASFGDLWPVGNVCRSNTGDPIVVFDHLANRWLLSQFASPSHMCIAISRTPNPTAGMWFLYTFNTGAFPDYPKFGVWPTGYFMSSYEFPSLGVYVFDRANMLSGLPAGFFKTTIPALGAPGVRDTRILPSDLDGPAPTSGNPANFFVRTVDSQQDPANPTDRIEIFSAVPNWAGGTFSFTLFNTLTPAPFQTMLCNRNGGGIRDCIPQPTVATNTVDALSNRPMMQLKYRRLGTIPTLVFTQTIDVGPSLAPVIGFTPVNEVAGLRWYELRRSGGVWSIRQQGTYAPQPAVTAEDQLKHRWMGSAAIDKKGNIALGFSLTDGDVGDPNFPSIRYTGRRAGDPLGQLPQGTKAIGDSANAQTQGLGARWGDYSAMSVDPVDNCTFWFTTHLAGAGGSGPRPTRIASFKFNGC